MGHHSTLIGGEKGEGSLFCSNAHKIIVSVVNVLINVIGAMLDEFYKRFSLFAILISSNMAKFSLSFESLENGRTPPNDDSSYRLNFDLGKKNEIHHYS